jgi:hypothetical protein
VGVEHPGDQVYLIPVYVDADMHFGRTARTPYVGDMEVVKDNRRYLLELGPSNCGDG